MNEKSPYRTHLDLLRIIACFLVIVNHTNSRLFMGQAPSAVWFFSCSMFFISKTAVPVFLMISGALLLCRDDGYKSCFRRLRRVVSALLLFSGFYFISSYKSFSEINAAEIKNFFINIYSGIQTRAFWYLYLYIGLLLMLPLLQKLAAGMKKSDYIFFFCCSFVITFVMPVAADYFSLPVYNDSIILPLFNGYLSYFIYGHIFENVYTKKSPGRFMAAAGLFAASIAFSVIMTYFEFIKDVNAYPYWDNRISFNVMISGVCIFYMAGYLPNLKYGGTAMRFLKTAGGCTFGIYLMSDILINKLEVIYTVSEKYIGRVPAVFLLEAAVFISGGIFIYYLRKLPFMRKII